MSTVFFKINNKQEQEVEQFMEEEGYTSKSEFFRFLIKFYKYHKSPDQLRFEKAATDLSNVLKKLSPRLHENTLSDLDDELADI